MSGTSGYRVALHWISEIRGYHLKHKLRVTAWWLLTISCVAVMRSGGLRHSFAYWFGPAALADV